MLDELALLLYALNKKYPTKIGDPLPKLILYLGGDGCIMGQNGLIFIFDNLDQLYDFVFNQKDAE